MITIILNNCAYVFTYLVFIYFCIIIVQKLYDIKCTISIFNKSYVKRKLYQKKSLISNILNGRGNKYK